MTDPRIDLALRFAEELILLQDMPATKAAKVAAAAHDVDADQLVTAWIGRLLAAIEARKERRRA